MSQYLSTLGYARDIEQNMTCISINFSVHMMAVLQIRWGLDNKLRLFSILSKKEPCDEAVHQHMFFGLCCNAGLISIKVLFLLRKKINSRIISNYHILLSSNCNLKGSFGGAFLKLIVW